jgi:LacI family transcriptional regulator
LMRIRAVIKQLGYFPNQAAQSLKGRGSKTLGLIIPSISDPFFSSCAEAVEKVARSHECLLIVAASNDNPNLEMEHLNALVRHRPNGLLLSPANSHSPSLAKFLTGLAIPVVSFDRPVRNAGISSVMSNNYGGAITAAKHLVSHGYKRILCLAGDTSLYTTTERIRGYRHAMEKAGLPSMIDTGTTDYKSTERAIELHLWSPKPPEAILTLKNLSTIYAFQVLQKLKVKIPTKVALLGFDDFELAATLQPSVSVVQQPVEDLGRIAAQLIFKEMASSHHGKPERIKLETRLVLRDSCGCSTGGS